MRVYGHIKCHNVIEAYELCPALLSTVFDYEKNKKKK